MTSTLSAAQHVRAQGPAPTAPGGAVPVARGPRFGHRTGFWVVAGAFLVAMAFTTVPTPLYPLYQQRDGFSTPMVTVIFSAYAVGVVAALLLVGHLSDVHGRKPVLVAAMGAEVLAAVLFLVWNDTVGLLVARLVCGLGIGALTATATAHLGELGARAGRGRSSATVATVANTGGLALGPLVGGVITQTVGVPLVVPFVLFGAVLAVGTVAVARVPETVDAPPVRPRYRPQRVTLPADASGPFLVAAAGAAAAFSVLGVFTSLTAVFLAGTLHVTSHLAAGAVVSGVIGAGTLAQLFLGGIGPRRQVLLGGVLMVSGLAVVAVAGPALSLPLFVTGGVLAGAGQGLVFRSAIGVAVTSSTPATRGAVLAAMFVAAYLGITLPVVAVGVALAHWAAPGVICVFALVVLAAVAVTTPLMLRRR